MNEKFRLGVNYWPRKKAMYWWSDFDRGEVREEFSLISELGMDLVRVFLMWDDFQPEPDRVVTARMNELEQVLEVAEDCGLELDITFFTGHMSGPNWPPRWLLDDAVPKGRCPVSVQGRKVGHGYRNPFEDPVAIRAEERLVTEIVGAFKSHPAVGIWNLGNEPDIFAVPDTVASGRTWCRRLVQRIRDLGAPQPVTLGVCTDSIQGNNNLPVHEVFAETDLAVMHGYAMYAGWARSPLDTEYIPYIAALTRALCDKPVLLEEFGGPTTGPGDASGVWRFAANGIDREQFMASEEAFAAHLETVLSRLVTVGATGAVLWCFADYVPELYHKPPCDEFLHERHFGLVRPDGTPKPHARVIRAFADDAPEVRKDAPRLPLDVSPEAFFEDPLASCERHFRKFLENEDLR